MTRAGPPVNVGRTLETGAILGALTLLLAATGLLLSPSVGALVPPLRGVQAELNALLYVSHMAAAALLVAFTLWHLVPWTHAFSRKAGVPAWRLVASYALLALVAVETATGLMLYFHLYDLLDKRVAVLVHLATTFVVLVPLGVHAWRGYGVWRARRDARATALDAARAAGKAETALAAQANASRRAFLRVSAYAAAGVALAIAFGRFTAGQVAAWRLNFVGAQPRLDERTYVLRLTGLFNRPLDLTYDELLAMPSRTVRITHRCVEGWTYTDDFTGVLLRDVLQRAGGLRPGAAQLIFKSPEVSRQWHGRGETYTTNFPAQDGLDGEAMVVWAVGRQPLPPEHGGPVRLMTPDKWGYKACKWLTEIEASPDRTYRGYWEKRGYHNDGDWPGPIFA